MAKLKNLTEVIDWTRDIKKELIEAMVNEFITLKTSGKGKCRSVRAGALFGPPNNTATYLFIRKIESYTIHGKITHELKTILLKSNNILITENKKDFFN